MSFTPMLPASMSGQMMMLALPATSLGRVTFLAATCGERAVSSWNSPSILRSGRLALATVTAFLTLSTKGLSALPVVE